MTSVVIEGKDVHTELDLHRALEEQLDFGDYYGRNLAALRDRLMNDVVRPVNVVWKNSDVSRAELGDELFTKITAIFSAAVQQDIEYGWDERFEFHLE